jgi:hypothetical protein
MTGLPLSAEALPGKWSSLEPSDAAAMAARLLTGNGAIVTSHTTESVVGYVETNGRRDPLIAFLWFLFCIVGFIVYVLRAPKDSRDPFSMTFHADNGGTRMHGAGQGRGADAVVWVADQIVAAGSTPRAGVEPPVEA